MQKPKHIIIEGVDGSGKTTLSKHLVEAHGYRYHHEGPPPAYISSLLDYYYGIVDSRSDIPTVFDRLALGELIYGPIFRQRSRISEYQYKEFMEYFREIGGVMVFCDPSYDAVYRHVFGFKEDRHEYEKDPIKHHQIYMQYEAWMKIVPPEVHMRNYNFSCSRVLGERPSVECGRWDFEKPVVEQGQ